MPDDQGLPHAIDCGIFWQQDEHAFDPRQLHSHGYGCHTQPVLFSRSRRYHPQLDEILRNDMQFFALLQKMFESAVNNRVQFVLRL
jgi:hypothetical protein